jgi:hypothetical protein
MKWKSIVDARMIKESTIVHIKENGNFRRSNRVLMSTLSTNGHLSTYYMFKSILTSLNW